MRRDGNPVLGVVVFSHRASYRLTGTGTAATSLSSTPSRSASHSGIWTRCTACHFIKSPSTSTGRTHEGAHDLASREYSVVCGRSSHHVLQAHTEAHRLSI